MPTGIYKRKPQDIQKRVASRIKGRKASEENHWNWKGEDVQYDALHTWVHRHYGKANKCDLVDATCSTRFEWSNISGEYKRDRNDFQQLCGSHHRRYDGIKPKLTMTDIKTIRKDYSDGKCTQYRMAKDYGVSRMTIWNIVHYKKWGYI